MSDQKVSFYMNMPAELKRKLIFIAQNGKPRRTLTGLITYITSMYASHILDPIEGLEDYVAELTSRTESFSMAEMMGGGDDGDLSEADAGLGE